MPKFWECPEEGCTSKHERVSNLRAHVKKVHKYTEDMLMAFNQMIIKKKAESKRGGTFKCVDCDYICTSKASYYRHRASSHRHIPRDLKCDPATIGLDDGVRPEIKPPIPAPLFEPPSKLLPMIKPDRYAGRGKLECPICPIVCTTQCQFTEHYICDHQNLIDIIRTSFPTETEYKAWYMDKCEETNSAFTTYSSYETSYGKVTLKRDGLATNDGTRFEQVEDNTHRTIIVRDFPASATVYNILECLGISADDMQKTEEENRPEHFFRRNHRTKQKECFITLKRATLAENCMQNNRNTILDGHRLKLTLMDTKTILKVDHQSVRISHLPPDISFDEIVDIFTRDVGEISIGEDGKPDVRFLFKFKKQTIVKITFESAELADKCVARNGEPFSEEFPSILKIRLFEIREQCGANLPTNGLVAPEDSPIKFNLVPNVVLVEADLSNIVKDCGEVVRVFIYKNKENVSEGAGTISFAQPAGAAACIEKLNGTKPEGWERNLQVLPFRSRADCNDKENGVRPEHLKTSADKKPKPAKDDQKKFTVVPNVVYVRGFPVKFLEADLSKIVQTCGKVVRVVIYKDEKNVSKGAGTISFAQPSDATSCIEKFNGTKPEGWERNLLIKPFRSRVEYNNKENASKPGQSYECIICFETYDGKDVMNCVPIVRGLGNRETHFTCKECVSGHAKALCSEGVVAQGGTGIPCGFPGCKRAILRAHLMPLLDDDTKMQLEKLMDKMALVNIRGMESCKSCDFGLILPNKWKMQFFHCENASCGAHFCRFCQIDFEVHIGKRCRDVEPGRRKEKERKKYEEALTKAVIRECRKCHLAYQKLDGCNKMTCSQCSTTQCYVCRKSNIGYDHFGESMGKCALFVYGKDPDQRNLDAVRRRARQNEWLDGVEL